MDPNREFEERRGEGIKLFFLISVLFALLIYAVSQMIGLGQPCSVGRGAAFAAVGPRRGPSQRPKPDRSSPPRRLARFPDSAEAGILRRGLAKARFAMPRKTMTFEFIVPTALAAALVITLSIVAVYLTDSYLGPVEPAEAHGYLAGGE
jgi:hypothetical protein